jgi:hypothetical protein
MPERVLDTAGDRWHAFDESNRSRDLARAAASNRRAFRPGDPPREQKQ